MNYNAFTSIYVIRHLHTSTYYGINQKIDKKNKIHRSFITCFKDRYAAEYVLRSINTYKFINNSNPQYQNICIYNKNELIPDNLIHPLDYCIYLQEMNLDSLLEMISKREIGLYYIENLSINDNNIQMNTIQLYPTLHFDKQVIEDDYYL